MKILYLSVPIANEESRREDAIKTVVEYLSSEYRQEGDYFFINETPLGPKIEDHRYEELEVLERNNKITEDDIKHLTWPSLVISFVNPKSYGQGFAEGFIIGRKLFGSNEEVRNVRILKLIDQKDWNDKESRIAGNSVHADLEFYTTAKEALGHVKNFLESTTNPEGNLKNTERE